MKTSLLARIRPSIDSYGHVHLFAASVPTRFASDLSDEEVTSFRLRFARTAAAFRLSRNVAVGVDLAAVLISWIVLSKDELVVWVATFAILCIAIAATNTLPKCPSCESRLSGRLGRFCPNCGAPELAPGRFRVPHCSGCCTNISGSKGHRHYKIRACTSCGLFVDAKGF